MVTTETVEGLVNGTLWFHYDLRNDILYLRVAADRATPTVAEETEEGHLLLRREDNDEVVGMTILDWWANHGQGELPDSIAQLEHHIEPWANKIAA